MKRRDFLALVSSASVGAALGTASSGCRPGVEAEGQLRLSPHRQGAGYPVRVTLDLPAGRELVAPPELVVVRDGVPDWWADFEAKIVSDRPGGWTFEWVPPQVGPTAIELENEVIRYRLVALDERGRPLDLACEPVEVVCARRGWSC